MRNAFSVLRRTRHEFSIRFFFLFIIKNAVSLRQLATLFRTLPHTSRLRTLRMHWLCRVWHTQDDSIDCQLNNYGSDNVSFVCRIIVLKLSKLRHFLLLLLSCVPFPPLAAACAATTNANWKHTLHAARCRPNGISIHSTRRITKLLSHTFLSCVKMNWRVSNFVTYCSRCDESRQCHRNN